MPVYRVIHKPTKRVGFIREDCLEAALLEIAGGGYTTAQVKNAMIWLAQLRGNEVVNSQNYTITPLTQEGVSPKLH